MTKDLLLLIALVIIWITIIIGAINETIVLSSIFSFFGFILIMVFLAWAIIKLIKIILS